MKTTPDDFPRLLRTGALLWSGYYLLLAGIDRLLAAPGSLQAPYLLFFGGSILLLPVLALLPGLPPRLGRAYPLLLLGLMGFLPLLGEALILSQAGLQPWLTVPASPGVFIRRWVPEFLVLALIAYGYRWTQVLLYVVAVTAFEIVLAALRLPPEALVGSVAFSLISAGILAALGFSINHILQRQRRQQATLQQANIQLLQLATTMEDLATSRERNRMARDLHDTLAHSLSGLIIQLETIDAYWDVDPEMARGLLGQSVETARSGLQETRRALKALRATPLEDLGLALALKQLAESAAERASLELSFKLPQQLPKLPDEMEQCIYRVAQEAATNVVHHANARHLDLWLTQANGQITLNVHDDGIGFDPAEVSHPGHYGVPGMEERAHLAGGSLRITTRPGQGTTITLDLPISTR